MTKDKSAAINDRKLEAKSHGGNSSPGSAQTAPKEKGKRKKGGSDKTGPDEHSLKNLDRLTKKELKELVLKYHSENTLLRSSSNKPDILSELRSQYSDFFENFPTGYFILDRDGKICRVNSIGATLLSLEKEELSGHTFNSLVLREDRKIFGRHIRNVLQVAGPHFCEIRLRKTDSFFYARLVSSAVTDNGGNVLEISCTVCDITDHKQTENKLYKNQAILKAIIDATDFMLVYLDPEFNFVWVNPAYAKACGMKPEEMAGRNHFELFPDPENEAIFRRVRDTGRAVFYKDKPFEFPNQPELGITYWDWSLTPYKNKEEQLVGLVFSLRETTKYKQAELELAKSEERFRRIAETSSDIIFQMDPKGTMTYCSSAVKLFGYELDQVIGHPYADFITGDELPKAMAAFTKINSGESLNLLETKLIRADGSTADFEISTTPIVRDGRVIGQQGIARDITERVRTENSLRRNEAQLQTVFNSLTEGVIVSDLEGRFLKWNPVALELHGFTFEPEYLCSFSEFKELFEMRTAEDEVLPFDQWPLNRILRGENLHDRIIHMRRLDQNWQRTIYFRGSLARDREGQPVLAILTLTDITQRRKAEEEVKQKNILLMGIKALFEAGLHCESEEELAEVTLAVAEQVTGSKFGFIGEISPDGRLHDVVVSDFAWELCTLHDQEGHRRPPGSLKIVGLYGKVILDGKPLLTNDPASHPCSIGIPPGHPPLSAFLGVPLVYGSNTIGLIALGNRKEGYRTTELKSLESLASVYIETLFKFRMEKALRESEALAHNSAVQFKQFFDFTPIPLLIAQDPECRVITGNLAAARMFGVDTEQNLSRTPLPGVETARISFFRKGRELSLNEMPLQHVVAHGTRMDEFEVDIVPPDGSKLLRMLGAATALFDDQGKVRGGIAAYMDISQRKWMEEQLLQAKQEWEMTFDSVPDLIAILDRQHRIIRANKAMADRLGLPPGQCISRTCFSCVHCSQQPVHNCPHIRTMKDGMEHVDEVYEENLGGYFLVTTTPLFDEEGEVFASVHVARDITERKKTEELMLESERLFKQAEKIAHLGSWQFDFKSNTFKWSEEVYHIYGLNPQQTAPSYEFFRQVVHPEDRQIVQEAYIESLKSGDNSFEIVHRIIRQETGEIRYVHEKCEHARDETGKVVNSMGMVHDITERKLAEKQIRLLNTELQSSVRKLEEINLELERSNWDLEQFVNIASHDLQEPLRSISSFLQLLQRRYHGQIDAKADTFINFAVEGATRMQELINDLLTFSRVGGGRLQIRRVSLQNIVDKVLRDLKISIEQNNVEIIMENLPYIHADEGQIIHLLQNLISNAIKFQGNEPPCIQISAERQGSETIVCVRDNGIGIDPQHNDRIFMLFQRLHLREEYSGTGIGLAICKKIVERHNGRIWVESTPGRGSVFCFSLPENR